MRGTIASNQLMEDTEYLLWRGYDMVQKRTPLSNKSAAQQECCHHWIIERPVGPASRCACKFGGMKREFQNYFRNCSLLDRGEVVKMQSIYGFEEARASEKSIFPQVEVGRS
jgi:hypothetical protein